MLGFEIIAVISVISIFAWFIMAAKNTNSQNRFMEDEIDDDAGSDAKK